MQQPPDPAAGRLIADQYADRPQLRPVLAAVLAAVPALGPVTVQARKTFVSLVSPRRTFAVVQAKVRRGGNSRANGLRGPIRRANRRTPLTRKNPMPPSSFKKKKNTKRPTASSSK